MAPELAQFLVQVGALLTIIGPIVAIALRRSTDAQKVINSDYPIVRTQLTKALSDIASLQRTQTQQAIDNALREGTLNEKVNQLQKQVDRERNRRMRDKDANIAKLAGLEAQLDTMKQVQAKLQEQLDAEISERETIQRDRDAKAIELRLAEERVSQLRVQLEALSEDILERDATIRALKRQLGIYDDSQDPQPSSTLLTLPNEGDLK